MSLNTYLYFNGNCEEAFKFYEKCLKGKIEAMFPAEGTPAESQMPAGWGKKIMHARLTAGDSVIMGSDAPPPPYSKPQGFSVNIGVTEAAEAERVFKALSEGGNIIMPLAETFWAI